MIRFINNQGINTSMLKRVFVSTLVFIASFYLILSPVAYAQLSQAQQKALAEGATYFNVDRCTSPTSNYQISQTSSNGSSGTPLQPLASLTGTQAISGTFLLGFPVSTPQSTIESVFQAYKPAGLFILGTTDAAAAGFNKQFFTQLAQDAGHNIVVASDEEGASIHRYSYNFNFPTAGQMGAMTDIEVRSIGQQVGEAMAANGLNTDLAPVLDVATDSSNTDAGTPDRAFSNDPTVIVDKAGAFAAGLQAGGINPVYKHFPGLGSTAGNSDTEPVTSPPLSQLEKKDLLPYTELDGQNGAGVMLDNASVPGLTAPGQVASTSPAAVSLLRNKYNFNGLITTDDLTAAGVGAPLPTAITNAIQAGVDMPLFTYTNNTDLNTAINNINISGIKTKANLEAIDSFLGNQTPDQSLGDCCQTASASLTGSTNGIEAFNFFIQKGLSPAAAAGIVGNMTEESSGVDPERLESHFSGEQPAESNEVQAVLNSGSYGWGIVQWTPPSSIISAAQKQGTTLQTIDTLSFQLSFLWNELNTSYPTVISQLKNASTPTQAADIFLSGFEKGDPNPTREAYAQAYYDLAVNKTPLPPSVTISTNQGGATSSAPVSTSSSSGSSCAGSSVSSSGYQNPYRDLQSPTPMRIDEGVDYGGSGPIYAIGDGTVVVADNGNAQWPGNNYITYKLTSGAYAGQYVYMAENCTPSVTVGEAVTSSTVICTLHNAYPYSEMGWSLGPQYNDTPLAHCSYINVPDGTATAFGYNFNQLLVSLGAASGTWQFSNQTGGVNLAGSLPDGWPNSPAAQAAPGQFTC